MAWATSRRLPGGLPKRPSLPLPRDAPTGTCRCSRPSFPPSTNRWMKRMLATASALDFEEVAKVFPATRGPDLLAITDITFHVRPREFVAVVGPSGCGKSTILNLTAGL